MAGRSAWVLAAILLAASGCGPRPGAAGLWELQIGGPARIVAEAGATEVAVPTLAQPLAKGRRPRKGESPKVETVTLATGTKVVVLAIDGDDARVRIEGGSRSGTILWMECRLLTAE